MEPAKTVHLTKELMTQGKFADQILAMTQFKSLRRMELVKLVQNILIQMKNSEHV
jgi:hypothetical protein